MRELKDLRWKPMWTSCMGCLQASLSGLGIKISDAWLFGGSGHAFVMNIHEVICPSGPTAWKNDTLFELGKNLGFELEFSIRSSRDAAEFKTQRKTAWKSCQMAVNQGLPCLGWELAAPEYYVIYGYDRKGYYYSGPGCDDGEGPKRWRELGCAGTRLLEMHAIKPGKPADDAKTVRDALEFALKFAESPEKWLSEKYSSGPNAYVVWSAALRNGTADAFGTAYNALVWAECRNFAAQFLVEAKQRLPDRCNELFNLAVQYYGTVAESLDELRQVFPFFVSAEEKMLHVTDKNRIEKATSLLDAAQNAEINGLEAIKGIIELL